ncbi:MAG: ribonuclease E inhibitor RraB [Dialister sp.]
MKEKREEFLGKIAAEGFTRINESADEDVDERNEYPYQIVVGREDDFCNTNSVTWYLMESAEELEGHYDGWGCVAVKE